MKTFLQSLLDIFRLNKWSTILNIIGLSLAFATFYVIVRQSWYEYSFDKHYPEHELIYRLERYDSQKFSDGFVRPMLSQIFRETSHIKACGLCYRYSDNINVSSAEKPETFCQGTMLRIDKGYTEVFGFHWVSGDIAAFDLSEENVVIPQSLAEKLFGTSDAAGKSIQVSKIQNDGNLTNTKGLVVAVYKDFPQNSTIFNGVYAYLGEFRKDEWGNGGFRGYVKVDSRDNIGTMTQSVNSINFPNNNGEKTVEDSGIRFFPMDDIYFYSQAEDGRFVREMARHGDAKITWLLFAFGFLIMTIAVINFVNFSMALAPTRIKSFNTQKVLGASTASLRFQYLMECMTISFMSYLISLVLIQIMGQSEITKLFITDISLGNKIEVLVFCACSSIIIGFFAGLWPSVFLTSVPPALALKGSFRLSPKGLRLRNLLIGFQFIVTFVLLIISLFFYLQNRYMLSAPLGFDKERTIVVSFSYEIRNQLPVIENQLKNYVGTQYLFATDNLLLNKTGLFQGWGVDGLFMNVVVVTPDIIPAMGIEIVEGRSFNPDELTGKALINESARKKYDLKIGDRWATYEIIGFIPDIKIFSFYKSSSTPLALLTGADRQFNMYLKLKPEVDVKEAIAYCKKTVEPFIEPFSGIVDFPVRMLDDVAEELYEKDLNQMRILSLL